MVSYEKVKNGISVYIMQEIAPLLPAGKGILVQAFAPVVIEANLKRYMGSEWIMGTGLVDGAMVNIDEIYKLLKTAAVGRWPVEFLGFEFNETDLDKLFRFIKEE